jgi:hypothetical protein
MADNRLLTGVRDDVDLNVHWWHRLFKVLYGIAAALAVLLAVGVIWGSGTKPEPTRKNVKVTANLWEFVTKHRPAGNVVDEFMALPGEVGKLGADRIEYLNSYSLSESYCTADATKGQEEIAAHLNRRNYGGKRVTDVDVMLQVADHVIANKTKGPISLCWLDGAVQGTDLSSIVKYEFTTYSMLEAYGDFAWKWLIALMAVHVVVMNLYWRGLVYVVKGPVKKTAAGNIDQPPPLNPTETQTP